MMSSYGWSHLSVTLLFAATVAAIRAARGMPDNARRPAWISALLGLVGGGVLSLVPVGDVDVAGCLLACSGELSFAMLFFLAVFWVSRSFPAVLSVEDRDWDGLRIGWAVTGFVLYGSALTGWEPDLYSLGFGSLLLWPALAGSAVLASSGRWLPAVFLLGLVWSWQLRLSGAVNFWDYALDPFLFAVSAVRVLAATVVASGGKWGRERKLVLRSG